MPNLATQLDLEKYGHVDITAEPDASITARLESASAIIESYCNRVFTSATVTAETHDGGTSIVFLRQPPVTSVTTVVENGVTLAASAYLLYPLDGRLVRMSGDYPYVWFWKPRTVTVSYVGGYTTVPYDIRNVCVTVALREFQAAAAWSSLPTGGSAIRSISLDGSDSVEYADSAQGGHATASVTRPVKLTPEEKEILDPYRIVNVA